MLSVIAYNEIAGIHAWTDCPSETLHNYLRTPHRHIFVIETEVPVIQSDREVEIFELQDKIEDYIRETYNHCGTLVDFGSESCEMIARRIAEAFNAISCTVREDSKGGARYVR